MPTQTRLVPTKRGWRVITALGTAGFVGLIILSGIMETVL